ncbi:MAG: hypothetical protein GWN16_00085 [Calditrichae bacterium]|nr:hypothetical protein [Calditrichia bacterium]NIW77936.1 hypothetical protein [Calditrichia bacterium]
MRRDDKFIWIFILCLLGFTGALFAGAWPQAKGHYYTKLTGIYSDASGIHGSASNATFTDYSLYLYGEYGLFERTSVVLSTPLVKQSQNEANFLLGETTGLVAGDVEIQAKYQFWDSGVVASLLGGVKIPLVYDVVDIPPLGNGETDLDGKLLIGASFYPIPAYATGDVGYRQRGGDFVDEINFSFEAGYTFFQKYLLRFLATGIRSVESAQGESTLLGFPLEQERTRAGGGIIYQLNNRLEIDVTYLNTFSGKNIPKSNEIFIGVAYKR